MALPTIHWRRLTGTLAGGQQLAVAHGVRTGQYPAGVIPNAVLADMNSGVYSEAPNIRIGEYQARTATFIYLQNFAGAQGAPHYYAVVARKFHSIDGANL